jgi:hypothetical protein
MYPKLKPGVTGGQRALVTLYTHVMTPATATSFQAALSAYAVPHAWSNVI